MFGRKKKPVLMDAERKERDAADRAELLALPEDFPFEVLRVADPYAAIATAGKRYVVSGWATARDEFLVVADENYTGANVLNEPLIAMAARNLADDVRQRRSEATLLGKYPPKVLS